MGASSGVLALSAYAHSVSVSAHHNRAGTHYMLITELVQSNRDRRISASLTAMGRGPHCPRV